MRKTLIRILVLIGALNLGGCYETHVKHFTTLTLNNPDLVNYNEISYRTGHTRLKITEEARNMKFVFRDQINPKALAITPEKTTQKNNSKKNKENDSTATDNALDWYNYNIELLFEDAFVITADFAMVSPLIPLPPVIPTQISKDKKLQCSVNNTSILMVVQEGNRNNRQYYRTDIKLLDKGFGEWITFKPRDFYLVDENGKKIYSTGIKSEYDEKQNETITRYEFPLNCMDLVGKKLVWKNMIFGGEKQQPITFDIGIVNGQASGLLIM